MLLLVYRLFMHILLQAITIDQILQDSEPYEFFGLPVHTKVIWR